MQGPTITGLITSGRATVIADQIVVVNVGQDGKPDPSREGSAEQDVSIATAVIETHPSVDADTFAVARLIALMERAS